MIRSNFQWHLFLETKINRLVAIPHQILSSNLRSCSFAIIYLEKIIEKAIKIVLSFLELR